MLGWIILGCYLLGGDDKKSAAPKKEKPDTKTVSKSYEKKWVAGKGFQAPSSPKLNLSSGPWNNKISGPWNAKK